MAEILIVRDPDPVRRRRAVAHAARDLSTRRALTVGQTELGGVALVWGASATAPADHYSGPAGDVLLIGDRIPGPGSERAGARDGPEPFGGVPVSVADGLHLAVSIAARGDVWVTGDLLGLIPVYYTRAGQADLVATSPGLLRAHPDFRDALDPVGLAALLLTNGLIDGLTLQRGVTRVGAGHALCLSADGSLRELEQYQVPVTAGLHEVPLQECAFRLHHALVQACARHVRQDIMHVLLLSGGLDSRLLAGLLVRQGAQLRAVTRGLPTDSDYRCARLVARHLGLPHHREHNEASGWTGFAAAVRWNGMASSPGLGGGGVARAVAGARRAVSGYLMDAIVGGSHIQWCYSPSDHQCGYSHFFRHLNHHGLKPEALGPLLRPAVFGSALEEALARTEAAYHRLGETDLEKAWRFDLAHRQRFVIGRMLVQQMDAAWPCAPHVDREVLEVAGAVPLGLLAARHLEVEILLRHHPDLARLPIDRGTNDTSPLAPDTRGMLRELPRRALQHLATRVGLPGPERRYYHRTFHLDSAPWQAVRHGAERWREAAYALFDPATFDHLLPKVGAPWPDGYGHVESIGRKLLLGCMAWLAGDESGVTGP